MEKRTARKAFEDWLWELGDDHLVYIVEHTEMPSELVSLVFKTRKERVKVRHAVARSANTSMVDLEELCNYQDEVVAGFARDNIKFRNSPFHQLNRQYIKYE
jgi:hypothetical protein